MKKWYQSKGVWLGLITIAASLVQLFTGLVINGEAQGVILGALVVLVRLITKEEIE